MGKKKEEEHLKVHKELKGFDIKINALGQIEAGYNIDAINDFLDDKVQDKRITEHGEEE